MLQPTQFARRAVEARGGRFSIAGQRISEAWDYQEIQNLPLGSVIVQGEQIRVCPLTMALCMES